MERRQYLVLLGMGTVPLTGCLSDLSDGDSDVSQTKTTPSETPTDTLPATATDTPSPETTTPTDDGDEETATNRDDTQQWHHASPLSIGGVVNGRVVGTTADESNRLVALDAATGTRQWTYQRDSYWYTMYPAFSVDDAIYFGQTTDDIAGPGAVYAVEFDGNERWSVETKGVRSLAIGETHVYAGLESTAVQAITRDSGTVRWEYDFVSKHDWNPPGAPEVAVAGGTLYAAGDELVAVDPSTPEALWTFDRDYGFYRIGEVDEGVLIVHTGVGPAAIAEGTQRWAVEDGSDLLELTADFVITENNDGTFRALDRTTGDTQWASQPATDPSVTLTRGPTRVYVVVNDVLYALNLADGSVAWQTQVATESPVALRHESDGSPELYVATEPSRIQQLDADGNMSWSAQVAGEISQVVAEESVYVATTAGISAFDP